MGGRIIRPDVSGHVIAGLPVVGRVKIGKKAVGNNGREYPTSVDYFIPSGKYAGLFTKALGEKPATLQIVFPSDDAAECCNERYEYRDNSGALVAHGDGRTFYVWDGKKYAEFSTEKYPDIMDRIAAKTPTKRGADNWDIVLTLKFIVPALSEVVGLWQFSTKGKASSVRNIRESYDGVQTLRGTVCNTGFDLSVKFHKSNKPGDSSRYPVVELVANDNIISEIQAALQPKKSLTMLLPGSEK